MHAYIHTTSADRGRLVSYKPGYMGPSMHARYLPLGELVWRAPALGEQRVQRCLYPAKSDLGIFIRSGVFHEHSFLFEM